MRSSSRIVLALLAVSFTGCNCSSSAIQDGGNGGGVGTGGGAATGGGSANGGGGGGGSATGGGGAAMGGGGGGGTGVCFPNPCTQPHRTVCTDDMGAAVCSCDSGFHDENGTCVADTMCMPTTCDSHGSCDADGGTVSCTCDPGYAPPNCATCATGYHDDGTGQCTMDPCSPNPCTQAHQTTCTAQGSMAQCSCDPGYHSDGAGGCAADVACMPSTCGGHGTCSAADGGISCTCDMGWAAPNCAGCASGYHDDGNGNCTSDPCLPDPCSGANQTVCAADGGTPVCSCDPGFHDDGAGHCTNDLCLPNPCAATNQACRVVNGMVQCYTPGCDDSNPCTTDLVDGGACQHLAVSDGTVCVASACFLGQTCTGGVCGGGTANSCDDGNPCTTDSCAAATGCAHAAVGAGTSCNDGLSCTTGDVCNAAGNCAGTVTPACGVTSCGTTTALGAIDIPVSHTSATVTLGGQPLPATNEYGSDIELYLVSKDTGQWHTFATFSYNSNLYGPTVTPLMVPGVYDLWYCHNCSTAPTGIAYETASNDAFPSGLRVLQSDVVLGAGSTALAIDIPVAQTTATVTLGGAALPATNEYGSDIELYLVSKDTGQWHTFATFSYNSNLYGPTVTPLMVPGTYDLWYCHNCSTSQPGIAYETASNDAFPSGLRVLQTGIVLNAGSNNLNIDIPVAQTTASITLAGATLPAMNEYGSDIELYLVSKDTGQWHTFATFSYNSSLYGPTVTPLMVPGTYDLWYCHNCSTAQPGIAYETATNDAFPSGLRVLQTNVSLAAGSNHLTIDIPVASTTATVTLAGAALPATNEYGSDIELYLVSSDTGQWHTFATFSYNSNLYGPTVTPRMVPGTYDLWYCHNCSTSKPGIAYETASNDAFPSGLRVLKTGIVLSAGSNSVAIDIPVASTTATVTLAGAALPSTNEYGSDIELYLVSSDTGQWHTFATFSYNSNLYGPTVTPRMVPGTYDLWYCHNCATGSGNIAYETASNDAFPSGLRVLKTGLVLSAGSNSLSLDIPSSPTSALVTLAGQPLPGTNEYGSDIEVYLVSKDTGQWHTFATFSYNSNLYGPTVTPRMVPGTYDLLYCHNCSTAKPGIAYETASNDAFPSGLRVLEPCVSVP